MKKREKLTVSHLALLAVLIFVGAALVTVLVGWMIGRDDAPGLAGVFAGLAGVSLAFYSWKARAENLIKLGLKNKIKMEDDNHGMDN